MATLFEKKNVWTAYSQLTLGFLLAASIPFVFLLYLFLHQVQDYQQKEDVAQARLTERLCNSIELHVEMHRRGIEAAAKQITIRSSITPPKKDELQAILESLHEQFPGFINLYFADPYAKTLAFFPEFNDAGKSMIGVDFSHRWHYLQLMRKKTTHISPVMKGEGGTEKLLITIVSPYFKGEEGAFLGFVLGALDLSKIGQLIDNLNLEENYFGVVVDSEGQVISSPNWEELSYPQKIEIASPKSSPRDQIISFSHVSEITNENVFSTQKTLESPNWLVRISRNSDDRNKAFIRLLTYGLLGLLALTLIITIIARKFSQEISSNLESLSILARNIAKGNFSTQERKNQARKSRIKEVRELSDSIVKMADDLKIAHEEMVEANRFLDDGVKHKTATLGAVLESMESGFALYDESGKLIFANKNLENLLDIQKSDIGTFENLIPYISTLEEKPKSWHKDGLDVNDFCGLIFKQSNTWLKVEMFEVKLDDHPIGYGLTVKDVTKRTQLEKLKNSLISVVAHEMKTPVTALRMELDTLKRKDVDWPKEFIQETIMDIDDDVRRLEHLVSDWLDVSRLESNTLRLIFSEVSLKDVCEEAASEVAKSKLFDIDISSEEDFCILADQKRLVQVFVNLFTNAVRYCDLSPVIKVQINKENSVAKISVKDNGIGIEAKYHEKIFEKFHQVDTSDSRRQGGTGLGLAICKGIIKAHQGTISVESSIGRGSIFKIELPIRRS